MAAVYSTIYKSIAATSLPRCYMTDPSTAPVTESSKIVELTRQFQSSTEKKQQQLIPELVSLGEAGLEVLSSYLKGRRTTPANPLDGLVYQALYDANTAKTQAFLQTDFPTGIVPLHSDQGIDYTNLQQLLVKRDFQEADRLTLEKLCELAGAAAKPRKWLYFSEVANFPITDLQTINNLWFVHSQGRFGFSVQRELWLSLSKNWDKLWPLIGWKAGNNWTRYPGEFTWNLDAPKGHLPLSNQLRGVRVMASLLSHPAWTNSSRS